jgi:hypothetical protein
LRVIAAGDPVVIDPEKFIDARLADMQDRLGVFGEHTRRSAGDGRLAEKPHATGRHDCSGLLQQQRLAGAALAGEHVTMPCGTRSSIVKTMSGGSRPFHRTTSALSIGSQAPRLPISTIRL